MAKLATLRLDGNKLYGLLPSWLSAFNGTTLGLSNNLFNGSIPSGMLAFPFTTGYRPGGPTYLSVQNDGVPSDGFYTVLPPTLTNIPGAFITECPAGRFRSGADTVTSGSLYFPAPICSPCPNGSVAAQAGAIYCSACPANQYSVGDGINCAPCPVNSVAPAGSESVANCSCVVGYVSAANGVSFACSQCGPGTFFSYNSAQAGVCNACPAGSISAAGAFTCTACPSGSYSNGNATLCVPCPANAVTAPYDPTKCQCALDYYDSQYGAAATPVCASCPAIGAVCIGGVVAAKAGYWRESVTSDVFYKCREGNCLQEVVGTALNTSRRLLQAPANSSTPTNCVAGNTGPLCALCLPGYTLQSGSCLPCDPAEAFTNWSRGAKAALLVCCIAAGTVALALLLFQPIVPSLERGWTALIGAARAALERLPCAFVFRRVEARLSMATPRRKLPPLSLDGRRSSSAAPTRAAIPADDAGKGHAGEGNHVAPLHASHTQHLRATTANLAHIVADIAMAAAFQEEMADDDNQGEASNNIFERLDDLLDTLQGFTKILVNLYQIVSTFLKSLDVPWPSVFVGMMSKVNLVNLNLTRLPKAACLNPAIDYYQAFQGYTLGLACAMALLMALYVFGKRVVAPITLRGLDGEEYTRRVSQFTSGMLNKTLLVLYFVYPGVSVAIFGLFSCTSLKSGKAYLDQDFGIVCYDRQHWRYIAGGIVWLFVVPLGVPCFFIWLLWRFRVPEMARLVADNAWLTEAAQLAWTRGLQQVSINQSALNVDTVSDNHLEALYAFLVDEVPLERAADIFSGIAPPVDASSADDTDDLAIPEDATARRARILAGLLKWCRTSGKLSLPMLDWGVLDENEAAMLEHKMYLDKLARREQRKQQDSGGKAPAAQLLQRLSTRIARPAAAASRRAPIRCADLAELQKKAMQDVGFLFAAYHTQCWYWETVELIRKLVLTSILALIAPGSAGQIVTGFLLAFASLLANLVIKPYAQSSLNAMNIGAQLNLTAFLFIGLLLKVNVDNEGSAGFFSGLVGFLCIVPVAMPFLIPLGTLLFGNKDAVELISVL